MKYFLGLDLGQSQDYSAAAIIERIAQGPGPNGEDVAPEKLSEARPVPPLLHVRHLQRFPLGTGYPAIVEQVGKLMDTPPMQGNCELIIDASGVGRPVCDIARAAGLKYTPVTITGGNSVNWDSGMALVPKRILVSTLQATLHTERLKFAEGLPEAPNLVKELLAFQVTLTESANDTYGGRSGVHDDLVLSVALAAWKAERPQWKLKDPPRSVSFRR